MTNKKALSLVDLMMTKISQDVIMPGNHWDPAVTLVTAFGDLLNYRSDLLDAIAVDEIRKEHERVCKEARLQTTISQQSMAAGKECICQHNLLDLEA